ncbi:hypothetical protein FISHEDRAFT_37101, partial [Fistulina hepatica ATCC 64428]
MAGEDAPEGFQFVAVQLLQSGSIVYELGTEADAQWLKQDAVLTAFMQQYGGDYSHQPREYPIMVRFLPTQMEIENSAVLRDVEKNNRLRPGEILHARWVKAIARRRENQAVANAAFYLATPEAANKAI